MSRVIILILLFGELTLADLLKRVSDVQVHGNELTVLDMLAEVDSQSAGSRPNPAVAPVASHCGAVVANYREAQRHVAAAGAVKRPPLSGPESFPLRELRPEPALPLLVAMADKAQLIMINEAHHVPQHRAFTIELLTRLR